MEIQFVHLNAKINIKWCIDTASNMLTSAPLTRGSFNCSPKRKYVNVDIFIIHFLREFSALHFKSHSSVQLANVLPKRKNERVKSTCRHEFHWSPCLCILLYLRSVTQKTYWKKNIIWRYLSIVLMGSYHTGLNFERSTSNQKSIYTYMQYNILYLIICSWKSEASNIRMKMHVHGHISIFTKPIWFNFLANIKKNIKNAQ